MLYSDSIHTLGFVGATGRFNFTQVQEDLEAFTHWHGV